MGFYLNKLYVVAVCVYPCVCSLAFAQVLTRDLPNVVTQQQ